jgi:hypothetical protein
MEIYLKKRENRRKKELIKISCIVYILLITVDMLKMLIKKGPLKKIVFKSIWQKTINIKQ